MGCAEDDVGSFDSEFLSILCGSAYLQLIKTSEDTNEKTKYFQKAWYDFPSMLRKRNIPMGQNVGDIQLNCLLSLYSREDWLSSVCFLREW